MLFYWLSTTPPTQTLPIFSPPGIGLDLKEMKGFQLIIDRSLASALYWRIPLISPLRDERESDWCTQQLTAVETLLSTILIRCSSNAGSGQSELPVKSLIRQIWDRSSRVWRRVMKVGLNELIRQKFWPRLSSVKNKKNLPKMQFLDWKV